MTPHETPRTIEELQAWYIARGLPPEDVTRFFIGKNVTEPRAFGIYREGDLFVVYKNKEDGSRAERYHGPDEGYAVNELYTKLRQEIAQQKGANVARTNAERRRDRLYSFIGILIVLLIVGVGTWLLIVFEKDRPNRGYYYYHDDWYYSDSDSWYIYEDEWVPYVAGEELTEHSDEYYLGASYEKQYGVEDFTLTEYYSTTDNDSDWSDSDSWDSDSTDWSSDW